MISGLVLKRDHGGIRKTGAQLRLFDNDAEVISDLAKIHSVSEAHVIRMLIAKQIELLESR